MNDKITKAAQIEGSEPSGEEMKYINRFALKELTLEDVFLFKTVICGNKIDRDHEVFPVASLQKLSELYDGKTVISDHKPSAMNQTARIYRTELIQTDEKLDTGELYTKLLAYCYMPRTDKNKDIILEIETGIKKEVSVGCAVNSAICSICGSDNRNAPCSHQPGQEYGGATCYFRLENPVDAYELSFVAVPAQPDAGVIKSYRDKKPAKTEQPIKSNAEKLISAFFKSIDMEEQK